MIYVLTQQNNQYHALYGLIDWSDGEARRRRDEKSESDVTQQCDGTAKVYDPGATLLVTANAT